MAQGWEGCIHTWLLGSEGIHVCAASSSCPAVAECCSMAPGSAVPMHCWFSPSLLPCPFSWVCTDQLASQRSEEPEGRVRTPKQLNLSLRPSVKLSPREPLMIKWAQKAFKQYIKATRTSFFDRILFEVDNAEALGFFFFFFFWSIHFCFSVAARPGNTICCSAMADAVLAVFPSHSEIGRTRCTANRIISVSLCSSFADLRASNMSDLWHV